MTEPLRSGCSNNGGERQPGPPRNGQRDEHQHSARLLHIAHDLARSIVVRYRARLLQTQYRSTRQTPQPDDDAHRAGFYAEQVNIWPILLSERLAS